MLTGSLRSPSRGFGHVGSRYWPSGVGCVRTWDARARSANCRRTLTSQSISSSRMRAEDISSSTMLDYISSIFLLLCHVDLPLQSIHMRSPTAFDSHGITQIAV